MSIDRLFRNLSDGDSRMLDIIDQVSGWLAQEASATSDLIEKKDLVGAQARLAQARKEVLPARRAVSEAMRNIYEIQATFVAAAGPV